MPAFSKRTTVSLMVILQLLSLLLFSLQTPGVAQAATVSPEWTYMRVWERTDWPVALGATARSWYWGPAPFAVTLESYDQSPSSLRKVQYWDKSRMEITNPDGNQSSKWFVTNGLLVREMVSGHVQTGDNQDQGYDVSPAQVPVSGDPAAYNPNAPTYASFKDLASLAMNNRADRQSGPVTATIDKSGNVRYDSSLASRYPETPTTYYENTLGHNIPSPFWRFMNLSGPVMVNHRLTVQSIEDWTFAFGFPISEAYWTRSRVGGVEKDVLVQLFERRALTYTPSNDPAFQVEMGNVGQHYYQWRYGYISNTAPAYTQPPTRLVIPKLGIDTPIEYVGVLPNNDMDVPAIPQNVAWYKYGARPGETGNAVIAGHRDYHNVGPVVFWSLDKLQPGDLIYVVNSVGDRLTFRVNEADSYLSDNSPGDRIFGPTSSANLNLITCVGDFDPSSRSYNKRLVVYTTLVS